MRSLKKTIYLKKPPKAQPASFRVHSRIFQAVFYEGGAGLPTCEHSRQLRQVFFDHHSFLKYSFLSKGTNHV